MVLRDVLEKLTYEFKENNYYQPKKPKGVHVPGIQINKIIFSLQNLFNETFPDNTKSCLFRFATVCVWKENVPVIGVHPVIQPTNPCKQFFSRLPAPTILLVTLLTSGANYPAAYTDMKLVEEPNGLMEKSYYELSCDYNQKIWEDNQKYLDFIFEIDHFMEDHYPDENIGLSKDFFNLVCIQFATYYGVPFAQILSDPYWREDYIKRWREKQQECNALLQLLR